MMGRLAGAAALAVALAACGTDGRDRTEGATTTPREVNLGKPVWNDRDLHLALDTGTTHKAAPKHPHHAKPVHARPAATEASQVPTPKDPRDRAYMGGGMVGTGAGTATPPTGSGGGAAPQ